ncbi:tRNA1(Val) (adenine(37)-N6)-methyltransferase [Cesiribacter andamanensis]|uniref:tRNA1(Val) (adenine(37)-N6)-methyltransferase n=1 Tax=Cesiribacter andamanensis AMV16 TaxID=1279009 RepID=M7MYK0_9BACT|nr:methyltransferase [Cesiribacter andamanensis]EMR01533.1 tRNA1(Val) (adenine(37)-N6)-methyltransferase [Cesiribacter andamanensis AMV16]
MANSWFQFKQFRVEQDRCPLKVGTDACLLGAWSQADSPSRILDIGTGTGLLALMLAQRYTAPILALEPDAQSAAQARENFASSPWPDRLQLLETRVQELKADTPFDLIVCNPPFYPHHLKAADARRNQALHQETLSFAELASACSRLLSPTGLCYILLPPRQAEEFERVASACGLLPQRKLLIRERPGSPIHRTVGGYGKGVKQEIQEEVLEIRDAAGAYSAAFRRLLKSYYLIF